MKDKLINYGILGMISVIIPGLGTLALPKVYSEESSNFIPRVVLALVIHFLMMITFMVKDCNKCRRKSDRRLSSNLHSGNIAIGVSVLLNIMLKYSSQSIGFLSFIGGLYDSPGGIALMTMMCNVAGIVISSIVTTIEGRKYCRKPKKIGIFMAFLGASLVASLGFAGLVLPNNSLIFGGGDDEE